MVFLAFTVTTVVYSFPPTKDAAWTLLVAAIFGTLVALLVFGLAPVSGGHINPAISFALAVTKKISFVRMLCYAAAQVGGAIVGTEIAASFHRSAYSAAGGAANGSDTYGWRELLGAEVLGTALLVFVVYATVDVERAGKVIHVGALGPLAIGGAVFAAHLMLIPIDGCGINPARSTGTAVVHGQWHQHFWVFWIGPLLGALSASVFYETCLKGLPAAMVNRLVEENKKGKDR